VSDESRGPGPDDEADRPEAERPGAGRSEGPPDAGELLGDVRALRRRTRLARHAYWFPLVLFGLLSVASIPFYLVRMPGWSVYKARGPGFLQSQYLGGFGGPFVGPNLPYYWLAALLAGLAATALWYRWRGNQVGLRTPARGYLITGLVLLVLALVIPVVAQHSSARFYLMPGDLLLRGTFPFVLIGIGLSVLAWAERSIGLTTIAALYLGLSLVASLYNIENLFYRLGWNLSPSTSALPNVVLPALMLLLCGAGAWLVQRRHGGRPSGAAAEAS
jgi:hypothetical protein